MRLKVGQITDTFIALATLNMFQGFEAGQQLLPKHKKTPFSRYVAMI